MKQVQMKINKIYPAAHLTVPGMGEYFRVCLYGQTRKGVEKVAVQTVLLQKKTDMDEGDWRDVWQYTADELLRLFVRKGWNAIRFLPPPLPTKVPTIGKKWKPTLEERG